MSRYSIKVSQTDRFQKFNNYKTVLHPQYNVLSHQSSLRSFKQSSTNISEAVSPVQKSSKTLKLPESSPDTDSLQLEIMPEILNNGLLIENRINQAHEEKKNAFADIREQLSILKSELLQLKSETKPKQASSTTSKTLKNFEALFSKTQQILRMPNSPL